MFCIKSFHTHEHYNQEERAAIKLTPGAKEGSFASSSCSPWRWDGDRDSSHLSSPISSFWGWRFLHIHQIDANQHHFAWCPQSHLGGALLKPFGGSQPCSSASSLQQRGCLCRALPRGGQQPSKEFMSTAFGGSDWCWSHLLKHGDSVSGATISLGAGTTGSKEALQAPRAAPCHPKPRG